MGVEVLEIEIILDSGNHGWILEKIAIRLCSQFNSLGIKAEILSAPSDRSNFKFWMQYTDKSLLKYSRNNSGTRFSALVTHVDDSLKLKNIIDLKKRGVDLVFMSSDHAKKIARDCGFEENFFSVRIGSDLLDLNEFRIGIVSKSYPDGRKNENWLIDLAKKGHLGKSELYIIGRGWGKHVKKLRKFGVDVKIFDDEENTYPNYSELIEITKSFDLFIYLGFDEGSMGSLDAYILDLNMLISRQGFHMEFHLDDSSLFSTYREFEHKFRSKRNVHLQRQQSLSDWKWESTAEALLEYWFQLKPDSHSRLSLPNTTSMLSSPARVRALLRMLPNTLYRVLFLRIPTKITKVLKSHASKL
jgi:hypothetical protein